MLITLLVILFLAVMVLSVICIKMKYELKIMGTIRTGYERQYNSFKMKYTILSKLENKQKVIENVSYLKQPVYIYGGGVVGDKLLNILQEGNIKVERVIEGQELKKNPKYGESLSTNLKIIVTPMFDYDNIITLLEKYFKKENIIGIDDIIN